MLEVLRHYVFELLLNIMFHAPMGRFQLELKLLLPIFPVGLGGLGVTCSLEIQDSRVQTQLRSMDFLGRKNPEYKSSRMDFKLGVPSLRFQAL